ncbi:hypothetical protein MASR2M29_01570 [Spirochaetota bacterium]
MNNISGLYALVAGRNNFGLAKESNGHVDVLLLEQAEQGFVLSTYSAQTEKLFFKNRPGHGISEFGREACVSLFFSSLFFKHSIKTWEYEPVNDFYDRLLKAAKNPTNQPLTDLAFALWAVCETALQRFSSDPQLLEALKQSRDDPEYLRFAKLNELYRAMLKKLLPFGLAAPAWPARLRAKINKNEKIGTIARHKAQGILERILLRSPRQVLESIPLLYGEDPGHLAFLPESLLVKTMDSKSRKH